MIASLSASTKTPVVISESDLDREAIASAVAMKIAFGNVPESLRNKRVFRLSLDTLARGAKTSEEFVIRLQSVLGEAAQAQGRIILFVDQLQEYAGARAATTATASVKEAIEASHLQIIGGASPEAYASYIAPDKSVARLFESISIDNLGDNASATTESSDKRRSPIDEEFVGDTISSDMRELMKSAGPNGRVTAILQVNDVDSPQVRSLLARHGVLVGNSMARLGAMKVELPVKAVEALAKSDAMNYISPDRQMESFGHVTSTTGADQVRNAPGLISSLLGSTAIDGSGVGIAVLDSGVDSGHMAFFNTALLPSSRIKFSKDFTNENNPSNDPYGHGSHVAGAAAGLSTSTGDSYQGIAPNANIISLRVLDRNGVGSVSALLNALNWILAPADPTKPVSSYQPAKQGQIQHPCRQHEFGSAGNRLVQERPGLPRIARIG